MKHHCKNFQHAPLSRREMLNRCAMGFGGLALSSMLSQETAAEITNPLAPKLGHFKARAKNVIFLYMDGGPSQVDIFDYKPALSTYDGQNAREAMGKLEPTQFDNIGKVMKSPWDFKQHGESGLWVSDLFPEISKMADELCVIKSMTSKFSEHTFANYFLHTGSGLQGRPSMGSWVGYGLGSVNQNLPGFVVLNGGLIPPGGLDNFGSGFLPAAYQGSVFNAGAAPVANIYPTESSNELQVSKLDFLRQLDEHSLADLGAVDKIESAISNYETAFNMQAAVPELMDLDGESDQIKKMYGLDDPTAGTKTFGRQCLVARRLIERGVRFIEVTCPGGAGDRWDQHGNLKDGHEKNCHNVDQPIAALLRDLKGRGLLDETLVIWSGEFGRTPFAQGSNGRDHNPWGFTSWMAGGGIKGGMTYGATDDFGYKAIDNKVEMHDFHATILHLLGVEHTESTFRFSGRDMRLTDVHGHVLHDIIA